MKICVYHDRLAPAIAGAIKSSLPHADVIAVSDVSIDPPGAHEIDILIARDFPAGLLARMPKLKWLQLTGVGYDHVKKGNPPPGLIITNAGSVPARAVAEFVWMGILGIAKGAPQLIRQQDKGIWRLPSARLLAGQTLVVVGLGGIGIEIVRRSVGFDMNVIAVTRTGRPSDLVNDVRSVDRLKETAREADFLVLAMPANDSTKNLISDDIIRSLPDQATVINVARSSVIDTKALAREIGQGRLRSALLDTLDEEPLPPESSLWHQEGLWITPHCAYHYQGHADDVATFIAENVCRFFRKEALNNICRV